MSHEIGHVAVLPLGGVFVGEQLAPAVARALIIRKFERVDALIT